MATSQSERPACNCNRKADRYISFNDIDCADNALRVMEYILTLIEEECC